MKIKTAELTGTQLNHLVAILQNIDFYWFEGDVLVKYQPTTDWIEGGPIIEREGIECQVHVIHNGMGRQQELAKQ